MALTMPTTRSKSDTPSIPVDVAKVLDRSKDVQAARQTRAGYEQRIVGELARLAGLEADLVDIDAQATEAALDAVDGGTLAQLDQLTAQLASVRAERDNVLRLLTAAAERRLGALTAVWGAEAAALRTVAVRLRSAAREHRARTARLLADLIDHEGCTYAPKMEEIDQDGLGIGNTRWFAQRPLSALLEDEANRLEQMATDRDGRKVPATGHVEVTGDTTALLEAALAREVATPAVVDLMTWASNAQVAARHALVAAAGTNPAQLGPAQQLAATGILAWDVAWKAGKVGSDSRVKVVPPPPTVLEVSASPIIPKGVDDEAWDAARKVGNPAKLVADVDDALAARLLDELAKALAAHDVDEKLAGDICRRAKGQVRARVVAVQSNRPSWRRGRLVSLSVSWPWNGTAKDAVVVAEVVKAP